MREGYKMTELGHVPVDWNVFALGEAFKLSSGEGLSKNEAKSGPYPVYGGNGISFYHSDYTHAESQIIIGRVGAYCGCIHKTQGKSWITDNALFIKEKLIDFNEEFLFYVLNQLELNKYANKNAQPVISGQKIYPLEVGFPSKTEQQKIAEILSTVDEKIDVIDAQITQTQELKKGLMQRLLTKGIGHTQFKDSPLGEIPKEWRIVTVGELLNEGILNKVQDGNHGEMHPISSDFVSDGIPFIMANCIAKSGKLDISLAKRISRSQYKTLRIGFSFPGDVLLTHKGTIGLTSVVEDCHGDLMLTPQVTLYRIGKPELLDNWYLHYFFQSDMFQTTINKYSKQSTRQYIGILAQHKLKIYLPKSISEQKKISAILTTVDQRLSIFQIKKELVQNLKKALMQQLLTGRLRVNHLINKPIHA